MKDGPPETPPPDPVIRQEPAPEPEPPRAPRCRRWKRILLAAGASAAALALAVFLAGPPVAASVARSKIESILGEKLDSAVTVGGLSISWSGRVEIRDFRVAPRGFASPLLEVKKVVVDASPISAIGGVYVAAMEVTAPKVVIEKDASGRFNYDFPRLKEGPGEKSAAEPKDARGARPCVRAVLKVREGEVVVRDRGRRTVFKDITVDANVDTLDKPVECSVSLNNPRGGRLTVVGSFDVGRKSGPVRVTLESVSLGNLAALASAYGGVEDLGGVLEGTLEYQIAGEGQDRGP